ncbi:MAG: cytochrome c [Gemmatimonadota bacterium]
MHGARVALVLLVGSGLAGCGKKADGPIPKDDPDKVERIHVTAKPDAADPHARQLARGAYVVKAGGCLVCHTALGPNGPDFTNAGAGGLEMPDPVAGTWRTPNITPDKASGIGSWTDDQIARAIREGTRPDGTQLYAIMPFALYNRMTDADVKAVVAYLRTLRPIERVVAPNKNLKIPQPTVPPPANAPDVTTDPVKHGEYLASMMVCGHCHMTPGEPDHLFGGGLDMTISTLGTGKLYAPNITPDKGTGIGAWSEENLYATLKTMVRPTGKAILPPMSLLQAGWSQLEEADLRAVATYIHQLPAIKHAVLPSTFVLKP